MSENNKKNVENSDEDLEINEKTQFDKYFNEYINFYPHLLNHDI